MTTGTTVRTATKANKRKTATIETKKRKVTTAKTAATKTTVITRSTV